MIWVEGVSSGRAFITKGIGKQSGETTGDGWTWERCRGFVSQGQTGKDFDVRPNGLSQIVPIWKEAEANMFHNLEHEGQVGERAEEC